MLGDCTGIGPEQCAKILSQRRMQDVARLLVVGDRRVLEMGARDAGVKLDIRVVKQPGEADASSNAVQMIDLANIDPAKIPRGAVSPESGRIAGETLKHMIELALEDRIDGITFAPLNKAALHAGGWKYNDEHVMFARLTGHQGFHGEMNVLDDKWMSRVTSHVSLREALEQITPRRVDDALDLAYETMKGAGFASPRIAVAALNPHGGENGLFGREEIDIIAPAVARGAARGIACKGPFAADTVFLAARRGDFDAVVSMYHDQGQIAMKLLGFDRGVTLLGGFPFPICTPAHGTAYDIAGKGVANIGATKAALLLAAQMAQRQATIRT